MVALTRRRQLTRTIDGEPGTSRRAFLRSSGGYATGAAALVGVPTAVLLESDTAQAATQSSPKVLPNPTTPVPDGPVMAYVHDVKAGTVVIVHGTTERTVQDHLLVGKLTHTPKPKKKAKAKKKVTTATKKKGG